MTGRAYDAPEYEALRAQYAGEPCHWCGDHARPDDPMVVDHEPPLRLGGSNASTVPAHYSCNARRGGQLGKALAGHRRPTPDPTGFVAPPRRSTW